jgi:hypothetical protein
MGIVVYAVAKVYLKFKILLKTEKKNIEIFKFSN